MVPPADANAHRKLCAPIYCETPYAVGTIGRVLCPCKRNFNLGEPFCSIMPLKFAPNPIIGKTHRMPMRPSAQVCAAERTCVCDRRSCGLRATTAPGSVIWNCLERLMRELAQRSDPQKLLADKTRRCSVDYRNKHNEREKQPQVRARHKLNRIRRITSIIALVTPHVGCWTVAHRRKE